ncbi:MAG: ABC transporter substrate-binding protein [Burkholderiales bacterium]|nr:ABC transporter substrate-binding protein [Burkholderiales bacterium]
MANAYRSRSHGFLRAGAIAAAIAVGAASPPPATAQGEIKIGIIEPLSGPIAAEGRRQLNGMEVVRDLINERGGIAGKRLTWVVADAPDATAATNQARRLITQEGVKLLAGTFSSSLCLPASDVAARSNVVYWEVSCVDPRFSVRGYKNVFRTEIDANGFGWYQLEFIRDTLHKKLGKDLKDLKIAFLSEDSAYGQGTTEAGRKRAQELGIRVISVDFYNRNTMTDFTPIILKLKSSRPDVLIANTYTNDAILFWQQARQLDLDVKAVVSAGAIGIGSPDFGKSLGATAEGPFALLEPAGMNAKALDKEVAALEAEIAKRYEAKYKEQYAASAQVGAAGMWILAEVLKKTGGDLSLDKVRAAALSLDIPVGGTLNGWGVKFQDNGQNATDRVQHYIVQWQNGKPVTVWPERFAVAPMKHVPLPKWSERK